MYWGRAIIIRMMIKKKFCWAMKVSGEAMTDKDAALDDPTKMENTGGIENKSPKE